MIKLSRNMKIAAGISGSAALAYVLWQQFGAPSQTAADAGGDATPAPTPDWMNRVELGQFPVVHRERADGVDQRLQDFLTWWEGNGPFKIAVVPLGGVRTDEATQTKLYAQGRWAPGPRAGEPGYPPLGKTVTNAPTLASTPHGRGGALDLAPYFRFSAQFDDWGPFEQIGTLAKAQGLKWGGDFSNPDGPHIEVPDWKSLPMPGPAVSGYRLRVRKSDLARFRIAALGAPLPKIGQAL